MFGVCHYYALQEVTGRREKLARRSWKDGPGEILWTPLVARTPRWKRTDGFGVIWTSPAPSEAAWAATWDIGGTEIGRARRIGWAVAFGRS